MKLAHVLHRVKRPFVRSPSFPGFDSIFYQYWYRDVLRFPSGPLAHYLSLGWKEGRDPSAGFSTSGYLEANPDVAEIGYNPLVHFINHGIAEGREGWRKDPDKPPPKPQPITDNAAPLLLSPPQKQDMSIRSSH